ncbi:MAG: ABC transporter permease [Firmicutes bacterium]|nr:ABC transporter permease [Bacillota bacterium]
MNVRDLIGLCVKNLLRRRTRSILAIIGVVVGTCAVVLMLSVGFGLTASYQAQIESYGNLHMINMYNYGGGGGMGSENQKGVISDKTLAEIEKIEGVTAAAPIESMNMTIGAGKYITNVDVKGINPEILEKFKYTLQDGRMLSSSDKDVLLFGAWVPQWFYNPQSKTWDDVNINVMREDLVMTADWYYGQKESDRPKDATEYPLYEVKACGVMEETNDDSDYCVYMNIARVEAIKKETAKAEKTRVQQPSKDGKTYEQALVYVEDLKYVEEVNKKLKDDGYQTSSPIDWLQAMKETSAMIQKILGGIGGISLIVAALSITNTMVMSVYERTREIGVMKVIGANLKDIRRLFLVEAGMIGFVGGVVGVALSLLLSLLMNTVLFDILSSVLGSIGGGYGTTISVVPLWLVFAAIAFATAIGVLAGYSPANRAMKLSALESLKNE